MLERHGHIDILVNCAAVASRGHALEMPLAEFEATLRLDLSAVFALSQAFARACVRRDLIALLDVLQQKKIKPLIAQRFPLAEARRAQELLGKGGVIGKIVLVRNASSPESGAV